MAKDTLKQKVKDLLSIGIINKDLLIGCIMLKRKKFKKEVF